MAKALIIALPYTWAMHVLALALALCNAHPVYRLVPHGAATAIRREAKEYYRAEERVRFSIAGPLTRARSHADGHRLIAARYARESGAVVSGMGASAPLAPRALERAVVTFVRDSKQELDREERSYDRVTDEGRQQDRGAALGYPSAPNAAGVCRG